MAQAKKVPDGAFRVVLTLTPREAETLRSVCSRISGDPGNTRRGDMDNIAAALQLVGIEGLDTICDDRARRGSITLYRS